MCPLSSRQTKNKRIYKLEKFEQLPLLRSRGRISSPGSDEIKLARRHTIQTLLVTASVVKVYVIMNRGNKFFTACELLEIIHL